jgi:imidazolonepropionase-like amidohydrolase
MKRMFVLILALTTGALAAAAVPVSAQDAPGRYLITNAAVVPAAGTRLERTSLLIVDGKIAAIGQNLAAPAGAKVIDASGLTVYPGFIDAFTHFGLSEIGAIAATVDSREMGRENPEVKAAWAINPQSVHFGTSRINGTTTALVAPQGGTFPGIAALVKMDGWTFPEMAVRDEAASLINFPTTPRRSGEGGVSAGGEAKDDVTSKLVDKIKEYLDEARRYLALKKAAAAAGRPLPAPDPKFEALAPVLDGRLPVILAVEKAKDIELAIKFVQEQKLKAIFRGCAQGYKVADKIKQAGIAVIIDSLYTGPSEPEEGYDAPYRNVVELAKAGVTICFSSGDDPAAGKDLTYHAAKAVAFGLPRDEALKALTVNPAAVYGLSERMGTIEAGKDADLFLATGDPLDAKSDVKMMFINGRPIDLSNWWSDAYNKWKARPIK